MSNPHLPQRSHQEFFTVLALLAAVIVVGVVLFFLRIESAGSTAPNGRYYFDPAVEQIKGCEPYNADIKIQLSEGRSSAADLFVSYNPNEVQVLNVNPGKAYQFHAVNEHDPNAGTITVNGLNFVGDGFQGTAVFLTIRFKSLPGTRSANFNIKFDGIGATTDSNIVDSQTHLDLLQQVTNADFSFSNPDCKETPPPPSPTPSPTPSPSPSPTPAPPPPSPSPSPTPSPSPNPPGNGGSNNPPPGLPRLSLDYQVTVRGSEYDPHEIPDISYGESFTVSGDTQPRQQVELVISSKIKLRTTSNQKGEWGFKINSEDLRVGSQTIQVRTYAPDGRFYFTPISGFYIVGEGPDGRQRAAASSGLTKEDRGIAIGVATAGVFVTGLGLLLTFQIKRVKLLLRD